MIKLYNTMARKKEVFEGIEEGKVGLYVCGPTVYNYIHIGNARTFISFDIIRRYFIWRGYEVTFVQNITDVDDKIIAKAQEDGTTAAEVAKFYTDAFVKDMQAAGVLDPDIRPKATEEIATMIALIQRLVESGHAYAVEGDVYFAVDSYEGYGKLSGRSLEDMESGHRDLRGGIAESRKQNEFDFALWKAAKPGEPSWDSPWGAGRPGWHIECSAMSEKYLGLPFDIHGGGADLVFPHHENERAQTEAACGCTFANYWMHGGMLRINSEKMSKSLGNFMLLHEVLETTDAAVVRTLMAQTHYRSPLDFSDERLHEADSALERIENAVKNLSWLGENAQAGTSEIDIQALTRLTQDIRDSFVAAMDDDFNTAEALGVVFSAVGEVNALVANKQAVLDDVQALQHFQSELIELMGVLGIELRLNEHGVQYPQEVVALAKEVAGYDGADAVQAVEALLKARTQARTEKNWDVADAVRDGLAGLGLRVEDTPQGPRVTAS